MDPHTRFLPPNGKLCPLTKRQTRLDSHVQTHHRTHRVEIEIPLITESEILDKNKGDFFTKLLRSLFKRV
jgi:hypothetical protein